ncbi:hypothetical protein BGW38_009351 [Lunasporangiospora selenospora]|uniref:MIR domain-containing protein n=1 Tax=Lunasporangiospora selenospora TaxID=979761 RepID=A0A9P6FXX1_9FUNG|nr:hypothetical protein BGW38_009351 [Lunasporangiospora selenospora]
MHIPTSFVSLAFLVSAILVNPSSAAPEIDEEFQKVTCGSSVKISNEKSGVRLHSHSIPYGSGSGQQSVTATPTKDDPNSLWLVMAQDGHTCNRGESVPCGATIRLKHVNTKKHLHSHHHSSPMSGGLEVSAYDGSDSGDDWTIECVNKSAKFWMRESDIRLKHVNTDRYLSTSSQFVFGNPIPGQQEVAAHSLNQQGDQTWSAQEGIYFAEEVKQEL